MDIPGSWAAMQRAIRNLGTRGLTQQAVSAVDIALWDLKARLLGLPLARLFGRIRDSVPGYGSGGFTSLSEDQLREQVEGWAAAGCRRMKIKVGESWGADPGRDAARVRLLRRYAGDDVGLMVDANGGYSRAQARRRGGVYDDLGVVSFEEPVSSDDLEGLALVPVPAQRLQRLERLREVAAAPGVQVSGHCAPALHAPLLAAVRNVADLEGFVDHARLEPLLVDGLPLVADGRPRSALGEAPWTSWLILSRATVATVAALCGCPRRKASVNDFAAPWA